MQHFDRTILTLEVGARASPLSKVQVKEIYDELFKYYPHIYFKTYYMSTIGDRDLVTSLKTLNRTDFFTKDVDTWVLQNYERIGIHSAKDLPSPLAKGLALFCLTKGLDPSDALVLRPNETIESLDPKAKIATCSIRREAMIKQLRSDFIVCDIRGTIEQRLAKLETGEVDGVVIAEAALIRLRLTHLNRIRLPDITAEGQGQLAVVGHMGNSKIQTLFAHMDVREKSNG